MSYPNFHSCRLKDPSLFRSDSFKTLHTKTKGLKIIVATLKRTGKSEVESFHYDKKNWSATRSRKHCDTKNGMFEPAKKTTKNRYLYDMHRKIHSMWNNEEADQRLLSKIHSLIVQEYKNSEMIHWSNDSLDKDIVVTRWNKTLSKNFDVASVESKPASFEYAICSKFLACHVKDLFLNSFIIPSPLLGTYLSGFKKVLSSFVLKDTRLFDYSGAELPPIYEVIKLNSKESDDFLISGVNFYPSIIVKYSPTFFGLNVSMITSLKNREWNKELMQRAHNWVIENNHMKNEKFSLNGEFLTTSKDKWDDLILEDDLKNTVMNSLKTLKQTGNIDNSRGMLFIGKPGTGKTKTGRVLMNTVNSTFIWVSSKDFSGDEGIDPIRSLSLAFKLSRELSPSILFIEDIDTWLRDYMIDLLKTELDGIQENKNIITILTTNNPERLPDTLLDRPGRFHDILEFKLPSEELRKKMLKNWIGDVDSKVLTEIIEKTDTFSGAHMKELCNYAKTLAEEEVINTNDALLRSLKKILRQRLLVEQLKETKEKILQD